MLRRIGSGLSHDLNNRLSVVTAHCDLLLQTLDPQSEAARDVETIRRAAADGAGTLRSFDLLADLPPTRWDDLDVDTVLRRLELPLGYVAGAGARLSLGINQPGRRATGQPAELERLVLIAATLVRDAMPQGGDVHVVTRSAAEPAGAAGAFVVEIRGEPTDGPPGAAGHLPTLDVPPAGPIASTYLRSLAEDLGGALDEDRAPIGELMLRITLPFDPSIRE